MGCFEKIKRQKLKIKQFKYGGMMNLIAHQKNYQKWHIQREDSRAQEETKEELIIKQKFLNWLKMQQQVSCTYTTEHTGTKENFTTEEKQYQKKKLKLLKKTRKYLKILHFHTKTTQF